MYQGFWQNAGLSEKYGKGTFSNNATKTGTTNKQTKKFFEVDVSWQAFFPFVIICDPAPLNKALWGDYQNQEW